jgi:hypothetical protein
VLKLFAVVKFITNRYVVFAVMLNDADNGTQIGNTWPVDAVSLSTENVGEVPTSVDAPENTETVKSDPAKTRA